MSLEYKSSVRENITNIQTYIVDESQKSTMYFRVSDVPQVLQKGKNLLRITAHPTNLVPGTQVYVDVRDSNGNAIYYEIPDYLENDKSRVISIWIYHDKGDDNTPNGEATITLAGIANVDMDGNPLPQRHRGKLNVKWQTTVSVDRDRNNTSEIIFDPTITPTLIVSQSTEQYQNQPQSGDILSLTTQTGKVQYINSGETPIIQTKDGTTFNSEMVGGSIIMDGFTSPARPLTTIENPLSSTFFSSSINEILNSTVLKPNTQFTTSFADRDDLTHTFDFVGEANYKIEYVQSGSNVNTENKRNFANITLGNIDPITGIVDKIKILHKSEGLPGDFELLNEVDVPFSSSVNIKVPIPSKNLNDPKILKLLYLNSEGGISRTQTISNPFVFDGDNIYIGGSENLISGSIFISNTLGTGIEIGGASSGFIRSVGFDGITSASLGKAPGGFVIYSGSGNLKMGEDFLNGVGMQFIGDNDDRHLIFTTDDGGLLDVKTDKFFIGTDSTQFISGSDGNIEISSSIFHLNPSANGGDGSLIIGANATILADLTVDNLRTPAVINGVASTETNSSSSIKADGFARFVSASIGGWGITTSSIEGGNLIMKPEGILQTRDFASGLKGWKISSEGNGTAEFENVRIRGTLRTTTFEKESVNAVGGQLWVANSTTITGSVTSGETTMSVKNASGFSAGEILLAKKVDNTGFQTEYILLESASVEGDNSNEDETYGRIYVQRAYGSGQQGDFVGDLASSAQAYEDGQVIVSTGKLNTGYIKMNANPNDTATPYMDIVERTGSGLYDVALKVRLGDLSGLANSDYVFGNSNPGFGLATDNVFLQGGIIAKTGSIGGIKMDDGKLFTGEGTYNNSNTGFYVDSGSNFSLGSKLAWNPTTEALTVRGSFQFADGTSVQTAVNDITASIESISTGSTAKTLIAGVDSQIFAFDDSTDSSSTPQSIVFSFAQQNLDDAIQSSDITITTADSNTVTNFSFDNNSISGGSGTVSGSISFTGAFNGGGLNGSKASLPITISCTNDSLTDSVKVFKIEGGVDGTAGADAVTTFLTNESHTLPSLNDGTVVSFEGAVTDMEVFEGTTNKNSVYTFSKDSTTSVSSSISDNTITITSMAHDSGSVIITATSASVSLSKTMTLSKSKQGTAGLPGAAAKLLTLTSDSQVFAFPSASSSTPEDNDILIIVNQQNLSGAVDASDITIKDSGGNTLTDPTFVASVTDGTGQVSGSITFAAVTPGGSSTVGGDKTKLPLTIEVAKDGLEDSLKIFKIDGGNEGEDGSDAVTAFLTNESHTFAADSTGAIAVFTGGETDMEVFEGITNKTSVYTISKTDGTGVTSAIAGNTVTISAMAHDSGSITVNASSGSVSIDKIMSLVKSKQGADGGDGTSAKLLIGSLDSQVMAFDDIDDSTSTPTSVEFSFQQQNLSGSAGYLTLQSTDITIALNGGGNITNFDFDNNDVVNGTGIVSGSISFTGNTDAGGMGGDKSKFPVTIAATKDGLNDTIKIFKVEGGADGTDSVQVILSNESHTLAAQPNGTVISFTGADTDVTVFEGITDKTSAYTISRTNGTGVSTNLIGDSGTYSAGDSNANVDVTGMTHDSGSVTINAASGSVSIDKIMSLTKAKQGQDGDKFADTSITTTINLTTLSVDDTLTFTADTGLAWTAGLTAVLSKDSSNFINGTVNSYNSANGAMSLNVDTITGGGSHTAWSLNVGGVAGPQGLSGANAKNIVASVDSQVFSFLSGSDNTSEPASIIFSFNQQNLNNATISSGDITITGADSTNITGFTLDNNDVDGNFSGIVSGSLSFSAATTAGGLGSDKAKLPVTISATKDGLTDSIKVFKVEGGTAGSDGTDAVTTFLTNEAHTFAAANDGTIVSFNGAFTDMEVFQGVTNVTSNYVISSSNGTGVTATDSDNTVTISALSHDSGSVLITATSGSTQLTKTMSLVKSKQGAQGLAGDDAKMLTITSDSPVFSFPSASSSTAIDNTIELIINQQNLSATIDTNDLVIKDANNVTLTNPTLTPTSLTNNTGLVSGSITFSGTVSGDKTKLPLEITITQDGLEDSLKIFKVEGGGDGANGTDAINGFLSNESHTFPADSTGAIASFVGGTSTMSVFEGVTDVTANYSYARTNGTGVTSALGGTNGNVLTISALGHDSGSVDITATSGSASITKTMSLTKARQGSDGSDGTSAKLLIGSLNSQVFSFLSGSDNTSDPLSIEFSFQQQNLSGSSGFLKIGSSDIDVRDSDNTQLTGFGFDNNDVSNGTGIVSGSITFASANNAGGVAGDKTKLPITITATKDGLSDSVKIFKVVGGVDGTSGTSAITALLTNDSHTLPVTSSIGVISYAGASTDIVVFQGTTDVTDDYTIARTSDSHITTTLSDDTITITESTTPFSGSVVITATSASVSLSKTMSISQALQGDDGAEGPEGAQGTDSKTVSLTAATNVITYDADGVTPSPSSTITLTADSQNFTDGYFKFTGDGISDESSYTNGSSANQDTFSFSVPTNYFSTPKTIRVGVSEQAADTTELAFDTVTIVAVKPGSQGIPGEPAFTQQFRYDDYDTNGNANGASRYTFQDPYSAASSYANNTYVRDDFSTATAVQFHKTDADGTDNSTYYDTLVVGDSFVYYISPDRWYQYTIATIDANQPSNRYNFELTFVGENVQVTESQIPTTAGTDVHFRFQRAIDGIDGAAGADAVTAFLTSEADVIPAASDGTVSSFAGSGTTMKVFEGITDKSTGAGYTYTLVNTTTGLTAALSNNVLTISGLTPDSGSTDIRATSGSVTIDKTYSVAKSKAGAAGANNQDFSYLDASLSGIGPIGSPGLLMNSEVFGFHNGISGTNGSLSDFTSFLDDSGNFYLGGNSGGMSGSSETSGYFAWNNTDRSLLISGSNANIEVDKFLLGTGTSQYISGSNGNVEIAGDVTFKGRPDNGDGNVVFFDDFSQYFGTAAIDGGNFPKNDGTGDAWWFNKKPELVLVTDSDCISGQALQIGNNSGDDEANFFSNQLIPFNESSLYEIEVRIKRTAGTSDTFAYVGISGMQSDGTTRVDYSGNSGTSGHYVTLQANNLGTGSGNGYFQIFKGYLKGTGTDNHLHNSKTDPANVRTEILNGYIRAYLLLNYNDKSGKTLVDYIKIKEFTSGGTSRISGDSITTGVLKSNNLDGTNGSIFKLDDGTFKLGGTASPKLEWDGSTLAVTGNITVSNPGDFADPNAEVPIIYDFSGNGSQVISNDQVFRNVFGTTGTYNNGGGTGNYYTESTEGIYFSTSNTNSAYAAGILSKNTQLRANNPVLNWDMKIQDVGTYMTFDVGIFKNNTQIKRTTSPVGGNMLYGIRFIQDDIAVRRYENDSTFTTHTGVIAVGDVIRLQIRVKSEGGAEMAVFKNGDFTTPLFTYTYGTDGTETSMTIGCVNAGYQQSSHMLKYVSFGGSAPASTIISGNGISTGKIESSTLTTSAGTEMDLDAATFKIGGTGAYTSNNGILLDGPNARFAVGNSGGSYIRFNQSGEDNKLVINTDNFDIDASGNVTVNGSITVTNPSDFADPNADDSTTSAVFNKIISPTSQVLAADGRPAGFYAGYQNNNVFTIISTDLNDGNGKVLDLYSSTDTTIGTVTQAVETQDDVTYKIRITLKGSSTRSNGFYLRVYERDSLTGADSYGTTVNFADNTLKGITNTADGEAGVVADTREKRFYGGSNRTGTTSFIDQSDSSTLNTENGPITTSYKTYEATYEPTSTCNLFSVNVLNWSSMQYDHLYIKDLQIIPIGVASGTTIGGDNIKTGTIKSLNLSPSKGSIIALDDGTMKMGGTTNPGLDVTEDGFVTVTNIVEKSVEVTSANKSQYYENYSSNTKTRLILDGSQGGSVTMNMTITPNNGPDYEINDIQFPTNAGSNAVAKLELTVLDDGVTFNETAISSGTTTYLNAKTLTYAF